MDLIVLDIESILYEQSPQDSKSCGDWVPRPGCMHGVARLSQAGIPVVLILMQQCMNDERVTLSCFHDLQKSLLQQMDEAGGHIDATLFCCHDADDLCQCHSVSDGLLAQVAARYDIDSPNVAVITDRYPTLQLACEGGYQSILLLTGEGESSLAMAKKTNIVDQVHTVDSLQKFVAHQLDS